MSHHSPCSSTLRLSKKEQEAEDLRLFPYRQEALIAKLPRKLQNFVNWLLVPKRHTLRVVLGIFFLLGGVFSFLPVLGLWMLPLGLILLAQDNPTCRRWTARLLGWAARRHPQWFVEK